MVVSDSNVRVGDDYVRDALSHAAPDVGLITHLVAGCGGRSFAAFAENLQLNCFVAPAICGVRFLAGRICVIGKSMFLRREALEQIGGFQSAGHVLAEDYMLGQAIVQAGYRWSPPRCRCLPGTRAGRWGASSVVTCVGL